MSKNNESTWDKIIKKANNYNLDIDTLNEVSDYKDNDIISITLETLKTLKKRGYVISYFAVLGKLQELFTKNEELKKLDLSEKKDLILLGTKKGLLPAIIYSAIFKRIRDMKWVIKEFQINLKVYKFSENHFEFPNIDFHTVLSYFYFKEGFLNQFEKLRISDPDIFERLRNAKFSNIHRYYANHRLIDSLLRMIVLYYYPKNEENIYPNKEVNLYFIKLLLENGADPTILPDKKRNSVYKIAETKKLKNLILEFVQKNPDNYQHGREIISSLNLNPTSNQKSKKKRDKTIDNEMEVSYLSQQTQKQILDAENKKLGKTKNKKRKRAKVSKSTSSSQEVFIQKDVLPIITESLLPPSFSISYILNSSNHGYGDIAPDNTPKVEDSYKRHKIDENQQYVSRGKISIDDILN